MIYSLSDKHPKVPDSAFVAADAVLVGDVQLGDHSSIWFGSILRGDNDRISVGNNSNIQEGSVIHVDPGHPAAIGNHVSVGHRAVLHGCEIGDFSLVGINAVVLNDAVVGAYCLLGANSMVTSGKTIPDRSLVMGSPGKVVRSLTDEECRELERAAEVYRQKISLYKSALKPLGHPD